MVGVASPTSLWQGDGRCVSDSRLSRFAAYVHDRYHFTLRGLYNPRNGDFVPDHTLCRRPATVCTAHGAELTFRRFNLFPLLSNGTTIFPPCHGFGVFNTHPLLSNGTTPAPSLYCGRYASSGAGKGMDLHLVGEAGLEPATY